MKKIHFSVLPLAAALCLAACGKPQQQAAPQPQQVEIVPAKAESAPLTRELVGRLSATRAADVRARVAGVLLERRYKEGSQVKQGQILFQIDPAPLQAAVNAAQAALTQAQANATNARTLAERSRELSTKGWVSKSELDNAEAGERSSAAQVQQAQANLETARINLGYATVRAPISGRAGQQQVTEGALVGEGAATLLTTVEQLDPIYVSFDQPANEVFQLRAAESGGSVKLTDSNKTRVELMLPDGTLYDKTGTLDFSAFTVNAQTGSMALRGQLPNPDLRLLPGMFVTVRVTLGEFNSAFLVPQAALQRDNTGPYVLIAANGKAEQRRVKTASLSGSHWIVTEGLKDGDPIIVGGLAKVRPGAPVTPQS